MSMYNQFAAHGVFVSVFDTGTLIIGKSGVGKSDLALSLLDRGHQLISDDMVEFFPTEEGSLLGRSPELLKGFLEVGGLGVVNVARLFGAQAVLEEKRLSLVVKLEESASPLARSQLDFNSTPWTFLNVTVPAFSLSVCEGRPREVLLEALVRTYHQAQNGYDANQHFLANHRKALSDSA